MTTKIEYRTERERVARIVRDLLKVHGVGFMPGKPLQPQAERDAIDAILRDSAPVVDREAVAIAGVDGQVLAAARELSAEQRENPEWLWFWVDQEDNGISFGRWQKRAQQAPYIHADLALLPRERIEPVCPQCAEAEKLLRSRPIVIEPPSSSQVEAGEREKCPACVSGRVRLKSASWNPQWTECVYCNGTGFLSRPAQADEGDTDNHQDEYHGEYGQWPERPTQTAGVVLSVSDQAEHVIGGRCTVKELVQAADVEFSDGSTALVRMSNLAPWTTERGE